MWAWGGGQGADCAGLPGSLGPGSGREQERSSLVRNEKISLLRRSSPTGHSDFTSEVGRKEEGFFSPPRIWLYLMARGGLQWLGNFTTSRTPSDASQVLRVLGLALHLLTRLCLEALTAL